MFNEEGTWKILKEEFDKLTQISKKEIKEGSMQRDTARRMLIFTQLFFFKTLHLTDKERTPFIDQTLKYIRKENQKMMNDPTFLKIVQKEQIKDLTYLG